MAWTFTDKPTRETEALVLDLIEAGWAGNVWSCQHGTLTGNRTTFPALRIADAHPETVWVIQHPEPGLWSWRIGSAQRIGTREEMVNDLLRK